MTPEVNTWPSWLPPEPTPVGQAIRLFADTPHAEVSAVIATLASYNNSGGEPLELAAMGREETLVLPGGLAAVDPGAEIYPSCCAGLEDWREWFSLLEGGQQPWLGHDPWPWVETVHDGFVVWADGGHGMPATDATPRIHFSRQELADSLSVVAADLSGFVDRLAIWVGKELPLAEVDLPAVFARHFGVR